jgi:regulator of CtrA degradation
MSVESKTGTSAGMGGNTISFGKKYTESEQFAGVFKEGMELVEATAAYLDGDGRQDAKALASANSLAYATESMRLTTRLMQLASWLLIRRAVNEGEMTPQQAFEEQNKVKFQTTASSVDKEVYDTLPARLRELNDASLSLHRRVIAIDKLLKTEMNDLVGNAPPAIIEHMSRLTEAFGPVVDTSSEAKPSGKTS